MATAQQLQAQISAALASGDYDLVAGLSAQLYEIPGAAEAGPLPVVTNGITYGITNGVVPALGPVAIPTVYGPTNGVAAVPAALPALAIPAIGAVAAYFGISTAVVAGILAMLGIDLGDNGAGQEDGIALPGYDWWNPTQQGVVNGVPISGPGVPEPPQHMIAKHWKIKMESQKYGTFQMYYWRLIDGRCMSYHSPTKTWHIWKPKKHIVISSNPRIKTLTKLSRLNKRVEKMLKPYTKTRVKIVGAGGKGTLSPLEKKVLAAAG